MTMTEVRTISQLSPKEFLALGAQQIAYVKPARRDGRPVFTIHAADGTEVGVTDDRDVAAAAVRQHGLEPLSVH